MSTQEVFARTVAGVVAAVWWAAYSYELWGKEWWGFPSFITGVALIFLNAMWRPK